MNEVSSLIFSLITGLFLGAFFFGGLWWTIQRGLSTKIPALWFMVSAVIRTILVITGFYYVGNGNWQRIVSCFIGFVIARFVSTRLSQNTKALHES